MNNVMKKAKAVHYADTEKMQKRHDDLLERLQKRIAEYDRLGTEQARLRKQGDKQLNAWVDELIDLSPKLRLRTKVHGDEPEMIVVESVEQGE